MVSGAAREQQQQLILLPSRLHRHLPLPLIARLASLVARRRFLKLLASLFRADATDAEADGHDGGRAEPDIGTLFDHHFGRAGYLSVLMMVLVRYLGYVVVVVVVVVAVADVVGVTSGARSDGVAPRDDHVVGSGGGRGSSYYVRRSHLGVVV